MLAVLDLEAWHFDASDLHKYLGTIQAFKLTCGGCTVGYYGYMPFANWLLYGYFAHKNAADLQQWLSFQRQSDAIGVASDAFMPSLYTWGTNITAWQRAARKAVAYARALNPNKRIYAFIWPQFDTHRAPTDLTFIPGAIWRKELETLYPITDGVIIWSNDKGPSGRRIKFSTRMPWYQVTETFMKQRDLR